MKYLVEYVYNGEWLQVSAHRLGRHMALRLQQEIEYREGLAARLVAAPL